MSLPSSDRNIGENRWSFASPDGDPRDAQPSDATPAIADSPEDLRSFILEVSAGRTGGVADATTLPDATAEVRPHRRRRFARGRGGAPATVARPLPEPASQPAEPPADAPAANDSAQEAGHGATAKIPIRVASAAASPSIKTTGAPSSSERAAPFRPASRLQARLPRPHRQAIPVCTASLGLHLLLLVALAVAGIAVAERPDELLLEIGPPPVEELLLAESDIEVEDSTDPVETIADEMPSELIDPGMAAFGELETTAALADVSATGEPALAAGSLGGDLGALVGENGAGLAEFDAGLGGAPTAKFFGSEIEGRRIVFVLDNSGSMQGGRLETVIAEVLRCIDSLRDDQEFYIIFHSDVVYPMLYPDPIDRYLRPTAANKRLVAEWLDTVELCLGDSVEEAIAAAATIEPDTVFLLSDGRIQGDKKFRYLLNAQVRNFPIHTFAVGMNSSVAGRKNLQLIADANGGNFTESEIPAEMRDLSREKLRPYHNETPGPIWGRHVKPFKFAK